MALTATFQAAGLDQFDRAVKSTATGLAEMDRVTKTAQSATRDFAKEATLARAQIENLTTAERDQLNAAVAMGASHRDIAKALDLSQGAIKLYKQQLDDTARATADADRATQTSTISLGKMIGAYISAEAIIGTVKTATRLLATEMVDLVQRGSKVASMREGFTALAGGVENAASTLQSMQRGTRGLVTDLDIMQSSNKAMLLGLGLSSDEMGELANTAQVLGRAMGQGATQSLNDLITALGRSSPLILDNLGLSVKVGEANEQYAAALGKSATALTDAEKKQAFMNAAMDSARERVAELGGGTLTLADRWQQLEVKLTNAADGMGEFISRSSELQAVLFTINNLLDDMAKKGGPAATAVGKVWEAWETYIKVGRTITPGLVAWNRLLEEQAAAAEKAAFQLEAAAIAAQALARLGKLNLSAAPLPGQAQDPWKMLEVQEQADRAAKKAADDAKKASDEARRELDRRQKDLRAYYNWLEERRFEDIARERAALEKSRAQWDAWFKFLKQQQAETKLLLSGVAVDVAKTMEPLKGTIISNMPKASDWAKAWAGMQTGLVGVLKNIPQTLSQAFTGGGGILGALKAIGIQIASAIVEGMGNIILNAITKQVATKAVTSSVTGGGGGGSSAATKTAVAGASVATLGIAAAAYAIYKVVQHNRHLNDEVRKYNAEIEKLRQGLLKQYGTLDDLEKKARAVGLSFEANWGHQGQGGLAAFNALMEEFERRTALSADLTRDLADAQGELNRLQEEARYTLQEMQADAQTLGINFDELGGVFAAAKIDDTATRYTNAISRLIEASGDPGAILSRSSEELSKLVEDAKRAGVALPENMKAWLEELVRAGLLTDANGEALKDLEGVKFGDRIKTETEIINEAMAALLETIQKIVDALDRLSAGAPIVGGTANPTVGGMPSFTAADAHALVNRVGNGGGTTTVPMTFEIDGRVVADYVLEVAGNRVALQTG